MRFKGRDEGREVRKRGEILVCGVRRKGRAKETREDGKTLGDVRSIGEEEGAREIGKEKVKLRCKVKGEEEAKEMRKGGGDV